MRWKRWAALISFALAFGAIGLVTSSHALTRYHYECSDGARFEVSFFPETQSAYLQMDGQSMLLPKRFSLISQRFKKDSYSFAMRADGKAIMKHQGKTSECQIAVPPSAPLSMINPPVDEATA